MAKAPTKTAPRPKRTRPEIRQEFSEIQEEVQTARESSDEKAEDLARHKETAVREAVEGVSVDGVVEQISKLGLEINRALSGISEKLVDEVNQLATLRLAASLERQELEDLVARQNGQLADKQNRMDEAKKQVQEIAMRAIEGASGAKTLAHVNEIAMELAKHRGTQS